MASRIPQIVTMATGTLVGMAFRSTLREVLSEIYAPVVVAIVSYLIGEIIVGFPTRFREVVAEVSIIGFFEVCFITKRFPVYNMPFLSTVGFALSSFRISSVACFLFRSVIVSAFIVCRASR